MKALLVVVVAELTIGSVTLENRFGKPFPMPRSKSSVLATPYAAKAPFVNEYIFIERTVAHAGTRGEFPDFRAPSRWSHSHLITSTVAHFGDPYAGISPSKSSLGAFYIVDIEKEGYPIRMLLKTFDQRHFLRTGR